MYGGGVGFHNGYEYVDLGLPSGLLWADRNIGAASLEDPGLYFQWGDTQGYTADQVGDGEGKKFFGWKDYKFSIGLGIEECSKYNESDGKTVLEPEDDAAHVLMGGNWKIPSLEDLKELIDNTDVYLIQTDYKEIHGSKIPGNEGNLIQWDEIPSISTFKGVKFCKKDDKQTYIFIPANGNASNGGFYNNNNNQSSCYLNIINSQSIASCYIFAFNNKSVHYSQWVYRCGGNPIRGVIEQ